MSTVELRGVSKSFGLAEVIHSLDLTIESGEFAVLLGPSGCGKSTLLRMVAGLEEVTEGDLFIDGEDVTEVDPKDRDIAMVFQNYALYPHMNVRENLAFSLKLKREKQPEIDARVARASEILGLDDYLQRFPRQLSGGQRQRVAMGRAIVRDPRVFLFDEPLSNLDAKLRVHMRIEIKALHQRLSATSIYVTHDQVEAMTMADRIIVMREGNIEQIGTPTHIYDRPVNRFVAEFVGAPAMNFISGKVSAVGDKTAVTLDNDATIVLANPLSADADGRRVDVGVRPEHIDLGETGDLSIPVELVEPMGRETLIYGRLGTDQLCIAPGKRHDFKPGDTAKICLQRDQIHVFDTESGARL